MTPPVADAETVRDNLAAVRRRIAEAGADPDAVTVLAVTKGFGPDAVRAAVDAGLDAVGESYAQELTHKAAQLRDEASVPRWHFIGQLQSNKVRMVADVVDCWQSVDRSSLVNEIAKRAPGAHIYVQVNATGESHKSGCAPDAAGDLVDAAQGAGLVVDGLMSIGVDDDAAATRQAFDVVRGLVDDLGLREASLGMTADLELAVAAGATMIRVGRALFGPRPT